MNEIHVNSSNDAPSATANALAALLRGRKDAKAAQNNLGTRRAEAAPPLALAPQVALITAAVRAALFAVQATGSLGQTKRRLISWNQPHVIGPGDFLETGTRPWFARTYISVKNTGTIPATVVVADHWLHLEPDQEHTVDGAWAAFIVRIRNASDDPNSQFTVTVT
ncbi:MAG: hypothetical protein HC841_03825 [Verrucomicrobiae bacterium]|nr:hypothetical protein [Verrucomicrobiae bacterium]